MVPVKLEAGVRYQVDIKGLETGDGTLDNGTSSSRDGGNSHICSRSMSRSGN